MSTTEATSDGTTEATSKTRLFLSRGVVAIAWSAVFAAVSDLATTGVTVGAAVLLVIYPLIDVVASVIVARGQRGSAGQLLLAGAAVSAVAAVALGVAATGSVGDVLASSASGRLSAVRRSSRLPCAAVRC